MKCREFAEIVHELARPGQLNEAETAIARAHAESCPACACLLAEAEGLAAIFRKASAESRSLEAPERVESALVAAFQNANAANLQRPRLWKRTWWLAMAGVCAAAAVALIAFVSLGRPMHDASSPVAAASSAAPAAITAPATAAEPATIAETEQKVAVAQPVLRHANLAAESGTSHVSGFVPVPFAGGFAQGDSGVIVRVQIPRAALAELGYPAEETQGGGMVRADLLIGEDGWPHAVRIAR